MNRASLSDYTAHVRYDGEKPVVVIVDQNLGRMSVTNNAEAVVTAVCKEAGLWPEDTIIIYRDSEGIWDGIDMDRGHAIFYAFCPRTVQDEDEAVRLILAAKCDDQSP